MEKNKFIENLISSEKKSIKKLKSGVPILVIANGLIVGGIYALNKYSYTNAYIKNHLAEYNQNITTELTPLTSELNEKYNIELTPSPNVLDQLNYYYGNMFQTHINKEQFYEILPKPGLESLYAHFGEVKAQLQDAINNITYNFIDWSVVNNQIFYNTLFSAVVSTIIIYAPTALWYLSSKRKIKKLKNLRFEEQNEQGL